ncbi:YrhB domain-containing protein [Chryseobacterium sp. JK1]|uniref:YrhB domain-containing protein n=1 Tax=Chryseobacterium sp. JK1 TaxID=874294 RepID=UPI003D688992
MLTDKEMLTIAQRFLKKLGEGGEDIEVIIDKIIKKPYGNIYSYDAKEYLLTGNFNKSLVGNGPFLVEKKAGRVVTFSTSSNLKDQLIAYENNSLPLCLKGYWYPDEDRFDYK